MYGLKMMFFGLVLIVFGVSLVYICGITRWDVMRVVGIIIPFIGLCVSAVGFISKE